MNWYKIAQNILENPEFKSWFSGSKVVDNNGNPLPVFHGTDKKFKKFDLDKCAMGTIWFTSNISSIQSGESGASGRSIIKKAYLNIKNPAGWDEYEKYGICELNGMGFDGVILDDNYVVWDTNQIKIIG